MQQAEVRDVESVWLGRSEAELGACEHESASLRILSRDQNSAAVNSISTMFVGRSRNKVDIRRLHRHFQLNQFGLLPPLGPPGTTLEPTLNTQGLKQPGWNVVPEKPEAEGSSQVGHSASSSWCRRPNTPPRAVYRTRTCAWAGVYHLSPVS